MIKINRVKKYFFNGLLLSCVALIMRTISVSFNIYVTGKIGAEGMGLLTLTGGIYGFAITFATSGINLAVVRLISSCFSDESTHFDKKADTRVRKIMQSALCYCLIFSLTASIILFISAKSIGLYILGDVRTVPSLKLLSFSLVPISISSALNGYFCGVRRVYKNVITQLFEQGAKIAVVSFLLITIAPAGLEYACVAVVGGGAISEIVSSIVSAFLYFFDRNLHSHKKSKNTGKTQKISHSVSKNNVFSIKTEKIALKSSDKIIPIALPVAVSAYVRSALSTIEHLAIPWGLKKSGINSSSALASYGILHGMVIPVLLFPSAILNAFSSLLVPELSSAVSLNDEARIKSIVSRVFDMTLIFAIGVSGVFICFSSEIGVFIYKSYEASRYIKLLAPLIPLMYLDGAVDAMLKGLGKQIYTMRVNIIDSLLSVLLIVALLPSFGIKGYVTVIFVTELINTSFSILKLLNVSNVKTPVNKWIIKPIVSIFLATAFSRLIFNFDMFFFFSGKLLTFIEIGFTAFLYLVISRFIGSITKKDTDFLKRIAKK